MEKSDMLLRSKGSGSLSGAIGLMRDFRRDIAGRKAYWVPLLLLSALAFGYSLFNQTLSIDDLSRGYYTLDGMAMVASTRWGMTLWALLFTTLEYTPYVDKFLGVIFWIAGATMAAALFYAVNGRKKRVWPYAVFSCLVVTYPLVNEIWEYNGANMIIPGNFMLACFALMLLVCRKRPGIGSMIAASLLLLPVAASYEAGLFVYVSLVFMLLYLRHCEADPASVRPWQWLREGLGFVPPLIIAIVLRYIIGYGLIALLGLEPVQVGATGIYWETSGFSEALFNVLYNAKVYGYGRLMYLPIAEFAAATAFFAVRCVVRSLRVRSVRPLLIGALLIISLFGLAIVQGDIMPYRTAQTVQIFVGFAGLLLSELSSPEAASPHPRRISALLTALLMFLSFRQAIYLHQLLALNHQRSENEIAIIHNIGDKLVSGFDLSKTVVFTGRVSLGSWIEDQITTEIGGSPTRFIGTNVRSMLNWSKTAFGSQREFAKYFGICGYDIKVIESPEGYETLQYYEDTAVSEGMAPLEVRDMGDYILVYLGA